MALKSSAAKHGPAHSLVALLGLRPLVSVPIRLVGRVRGRAWVETEGRRRTSHAVVRVSKPGTGKVEISHKSRPDLIFDISYFYALKDRHQLMFPLQFSKLLGLVDIKAEVEGGGPSGQSGAIRYATAMAIRSFVDKETVDEMKLVGLLTQDIRVRERKKPGQVKARKSYTWKRR